MTPFFAFHGIIWVITLPFLSAAATFILRGKNAPLISLLTALWITFTSFLLVYELVYTGPIQYDLGAWGAPVGIELKLDGLSALMIMATALLGLAVTLYAQKFFMSLDYGVFFWPLWMCAWGGLNALFLSADIFNLYVCLEVMSLSAVALVALSGKETAVSSALRYLLMSVLGSLIYLMGVAILYGAYGTLDLASFGDKVSWGIVSVSALGFVAIGILIKSALFPFHFWLPPAHANAPAPVSAVLSGLVIMAAYYILIRFWFEPFYSIITPFMGQLLGGLGVVTIFYSSVLAFKQQRLKMLLAYSTVAQVGYMFLIFPLAADHSVGELFAWSGGIYFALSHAFAKGSAFLVAGSIIHGKGNDKINEFSGLAEKHPFGVFTLAVAGLSLMGLPPSGGFVAKWQLLKAALLSGQWIYAFVMIFGSLMTAAYLFKVFEISLKKSEDKSPLIVPPVMQYTAFCLATAALLMGLVATLPLKILKLDPPKSISLSGEKL